MDTKDKSVLRDNQILITVSKTVDIVDNWTEGTKLLLGTIRILISVSKTVDIEDNWTQRTNL